MNKQEVRYTVKELLDKIKEIKGEPGMLILKKENYTIVKSSKGKYFKLYKVDNVIVYGISLEKKDKKYITNW